MRWRHIRNLHTDEGRQEFRTFITDIFYVEEHLIDICDAIADAVIRYLQGKGEQIRISDDEKEKKLQHVRQLFADKRKLLGIE